MIEDYRSHIDSEVADVKNIGDRWGGAITAAWFLAEFAGDTPWVHLDIAGPAFTERAHDLGPIGATGARLMTSLLHELERRRGRYALQTMCEGGGQANVTIIERL